MKGQDTRSLSLYFRNEHIRLKNLSYDIVNLWMTNVFKDVVTASCDITIFIDECLQL